MEVIKMSYCVHCGVKLASYQNVCPLCSTPVIDPNPSEKSTPRFVDYIETKDRHINRHFASLLITVISLIPFIVTAIVDLCINHKLSWSIYILGADWCFLAIVVFPFRYYLKNTYWYIIVDGIAIAAYLVVIYFLASASLTLLYIGLMITLLCTLIALSIVYFIKKPHKSKGTLIGWLTVTTSFLPFGIDVIINYFIHHTIMPSWSFWVTIPSLVLGIILVIIARNENVYQWIKKNIFI